MDDTSPATKGDLKKLEQRLITAVGNELHQRFERVDQRFDRVHEDFDRMLNILGNTDRQVKNHEKRITRLEKVTA